ncbi:septum formation initiator family protein [Alkalibacter rhizosphaerae]|uniref:Septum formation initiator family protein n=1 Tax=Alkalibacter rhizosphaerae TaxID=2815577 RepID=A0A974XN42_9FIRM|nr:septum formation initiator family protein [Alkalibacter rhizosphaerae]QSX08926.1 septum formation initiator family protein [Alkalibacter rhizosphaerae]
MVISEKKLYNYYLEDDDIAITRIRNKYEKKQRMKPMTKAKCLMMVFVLFFMGMGVLYQYSRINAVNQDIVQMEKDLKEIQMINDSKEGQIVSSLDLNHIENYAKSVLGMVEPASDQYTYLAINEGVRTAEGNAVKTVSVASQSKLVSWIAKLIN